jgi:hypothetical protein
LKGGLVLSFEGHITKDGEFWLVEIPGLNLMTQGRIKSEAYKMAKSIVIDASGNLKLKIKLIKTGLNTFSLFSEDLDTLIPLLLKKQRQKAGLTVLQASKQLGSNSPNAYGVYEQGKAKPTLKKLDELLSAVNPEHAVKLSCA